MSIKNYEHSHISVLDNSKLEYKIVLTENIFNIGNKTIINYCQDNKILIILSESVNKFFYSEINEYFNFHHDKFKIITIPTTEYNKNVENAINICKEGKDFGLDRNSLMIAIGGGILTDLVGFAASMYKRKIDYIKIPTTLVGQVDAGIGIKTGVNFGDSKNFLGTYHPPLATLNDIKLLSTLDDLDILCGLAEIIKMAIVKDSYLFELIESNYINLISNCFQDNKKVSQQVIQRSIIRMLEELDGNFHEHILERIVDFGHTFSPFIEVHTNYRISHGIAVALDIAISTELNYIRSGISKIDRDRILKLILDIGLEIYDEETFDRDLMWKSLENIVLHRGLKLNLVVPAGIGESSFIRDVNEISPELLEQTFVNLKDYSTTNRGHKYEGLCSS